MTTKRSCSLLRSLCTACGLGLVAFASIAHAQSVDRVELQDQDRVRRADVRASVNSFAHIDASTIGERRALSDEERSEMRRQIDEAIRKAYGRQERGRD
jgi:hypothetical protein